MDVKSLPYHFAKPGALSKDRIEKCFSFEVVGTDYAGPIYYKALNKSELKVYILLFFCSITRAVYIDLVSNFTTIEFIKSFERLRRGKPKIVYCENAKAFNVGAKCQANINKDQKLHNFLNSETITWKFNVPKSPCWGGQFERLIGLIKSSLYRTIRKAQLTWAESEEVLLDIQIILNIPLT